MNRNAVEEIERNISLAKEMVDAGASLERLRDNRDFKKVVLEGYFEKEAIRLVHLKSDPNFQTAERQQAILSQIDAIGALSQYFGVVAHTAALAAKGIEADEATRDEILAEGLE